MTDIYDNYCSGASAVASMLTIYIEEAHASDRWFFPNAPDVKTGDAIIATHHSIEDRLAAAKKFVAKKTFKCELVVDSMDGDIVDRYEAWPERLYIIVDGVVVYKGGIGPFDYRLPEVKEWLSSKYGFRGKSIDRNKM